MGARALCPPTPCESAALAAGLTLAAQPLEPPRFHPVDWHELQRFTMADDPDRTALPWRAPDFVRSAPGPRLAEVQVQELKLPQKPSPTSFARVLRNVLSEKDCASLIAAVNG